MIPNSIYRFRLLALFLLIAMGSAAQKNANYFHISGTIRVDNGDPAGAVVSLVNSVTNKPENSATVNTTGKFEFDLPFFSEFKMSVVKDNHYTKDIDVSTMIPSLVWAKDSIFPPFRMVVTIYKRVPNVTLSFEGKVVGKISYSPKGKLDNFDSNIFIDDKEIRKEIDQAIKAHEDEIFNAKMAEAVEFEKKNQIREAIHAYEEALAMRKNDPYIKPKLKELASDLKNMEKDALLDAEFNRWIVSGDDNVAKLKYPEAIVNFKSALTVKPGNQIASDKLTAAEQLLAKANAEKAKLDAEFNLQLAAGDALVNEKKYNEAIEKFKGALVMKPANTVAADKLANAEKLLSLANADKAKLEAEFKRLLADGDENVAKLKFPEAIVNFKDALKIKPQDVVATSSLANAERLLAQLNADKAKQEAEFNRLLAAGDVNVTDQKYPEAIGNFKSALAIKVGDKIASDKLANAEKLLAQANADKAKQEAEFNRLLAAGDANVAGQKYPEAIENFKGALVIKTGDKIATGKLANAEKLLAQVNADKAKQEAEFNRMLAAGDVNVAGQKYPEAIGNFKAALAIKVGDKIATDKLANAERLLAQANADKAKQEAEFNRLLAAGDANVTDQKYPEAIGNFKAALAIKVGDKITTDKLANAERLLAQANADKAKQEAEFNRLLAAGDANVTDQKYPEAIGNFKGALAIKVGDKIASDKLANAEKLLAQANADKAKQEAEFNRILAAGDANVAGQKYPEAIGNFKAALAIKVGDKIATDKLANAEKLLAQVNADKAKQEAEFNRLLAAGDANVTDQKYPEAIGNFKGALAIKVGDKIASDKLANAEKLLAQANADKAKLEAEFNRMLAAGDANVAGQKYPEAIGNFKAALAIKVGDKIATDKLANSEKLLAQANADKAKQEAEFNRLLAAGDVNVSGQKYPEAIGNFKGALAIKVGDKIASDKLANAEKLLAQANADKAKQEAEFNRLLAAGDANVSGQKYPEAIGNFKAALAIKVGDKIASDKLANAEKLLAQANADKAKQEAEFNRLLAAGDVNVTDQKYSEAIGNFKGALAIKVGDKIASDKLANAEKLLAQANADKAKQEAEFNRLLAAGDANVAGQKYPEAIGNFKAALAIKVGDKIATDKLANSEKLLAQANADKAKQEAEFNRLLAAGDVNVSGQKYPEAIGNFKGALAIKVGDKIASDKLANAEKLLAQANADKAKQEAEFNRLLAAGDANVSGQKYPEAIENFKGALVIKTGDKIASGKLANAEKLLAQANADKAKQEAEFNRLLAAGDVNVTDQKYPEAIGNFKDALKIMPGNQVATSKLSEAEKLLALFLADKLKKETEQKLLAEKEKKYKMTIARADELFAAKTYLDARNQYKEAIKISDIENYPKSRIIEIDSLLAKLAADKLLAQKMADEQRKLQGEGSYLKNIQTGDANYAKSLWMVAIFYYQEALKYKAGDKYAGERVDDCKKMIGSNITAEIMQRYTSLLKNADEDLQAKKYSSSRFYYGEAARILPWENYPKGQLILVEKLISSSDVNGIEKQYFDAIKKADDAVVQKNFAIARFYFQKAISLKPAEEYPKQQLQRLSSEK
jgi:tetratricopeptide (TPR) repeat protein